MFWNDEATVAIWDVAAGEVTSTVDLERINPDANDLRFSPDGQLMAGAAQPERVWTARLWDATTGDPAADLVAPDDAGSIETLAFSPDSSALVMASQRAVTVWDVAGGEIAHTLPLTGVTDTTVECAEPVGAGLVAVVRQDGTLEMWSLPE